MTERWSDETEKLLIEASNQHIALQNTGSSYRCSCGEVFEISDRSLNGFEALRLHQFRTTLATLADAGVLVPPSAVSS